MERVRTVFPITSIRPRWDPRDGALDGVYEMTVDGVAVANYFGREARYRYDL